MPSATHAIPAALKNSCKGTVNYLNMGSMAQFFLLDLNSRNSSQFIVYNYHFLSQYALIPILMQKAHRNNSYFFGYAWSLWKL